MASNSLPKIFQIFVNFLGLFENVTKNCLRLLFGPLLEKIVLLFIPISGHADAIVGQGLFVARLRGKVMGSSTTWRKGQK